MISLEDLNFVGSDLYRPECVLASKSGHLYTADWRGGVGVTFPNGESHLLKHKTSVSWLKPNGIALMPNGDFLITHLGDDKGGVYRLDGKGFLTPFLEEIEKIPMPPTNYVCRDNLGRIWITISTKQIPRHSAAKPNFGDGFIILMDDKGTRVVADDLGFANECVLSPDGDWLYVNETFGRKLTRFRVKKNGNLEKAETVTEFGESEFPDGVIFDDEGYLWVTSIVSNRIYRVSTVGKKVLWLEDFDEIGAKELESKYQMGLLEGKDFTKLNPKKLKNISSMAFGGKDLKKVWLGCLQGSSLATFNLPVKGIKPIHWEVLPNWLANLKNLRV